MKLAVGWVRIIVYTPPAAGVVNLNQSATSVANANQVTGKDFYHPEMYFQMKDNYAEQGLEPMTTKTFDIKVND